MGVPCVPVRPVEDIAIDLVRSADGLQAYRVNSRRIAADLEARWAANRAQADLRRTLSQGISS